MTAPTSPQISGREDRTAPGGLSAAEVADRVARGLTNDVPSPTSRSYAEIIRANVFTRFNALLGALLVAIIAVREFRDGLFGIVLVLNALIGIVQEIRAKRTLDRLTLLSAPKARVWRDGTVVELPVGQIVLDDLVELVPGDQIVVDGDVVEAAGLEVDESLLTGESDPVVKHEGDEVLSGSFVAAGRGICVASRVGALTYAHRVREDASRFVVVKSELRDGLNAILRVITWLIVPTAALLIWAQTSNHEGTVEAVQGSVAGLVAMVPEGLVLLTSAALAIGVLRLGRKQVLTQELAAIEGLARVDTLCVDKTGTLTEGSLVLASIEVVGTRAEDDCARILAALGAADATPNGSMLAVIDAYGTPPSGDGWDPTGAVPFSSTRKWSACSFRSEGSWFLGAPDILVSQLTGHGAAEVSEQVYRFAATGRRVLLLCESPSGLAGEHLPEGLWAICLVVLEERIRADAPDTIAYFGQQGVAVKVISGDNPTTVGAVAQRCGVPGAEHPVDARDLPDDLEALADVMEERSVFGRVTPHQKRAMVHALQSRGHEVAMTGDGVNDTLALKDAEIGVAMGSGSAAARSVARFVLLDNSFAVFPSVVAEGRRVIANVERVANLFLTKSMYALVLAVAVGVTSSAYPFKPRHMSVISTLTIGVPAFILALAPNARRALPGFVDRALRFSIPAGLVTGIATFVAFKVAASKVDLEGAQTCALIVLYVVATWVLSILSRPINLWRGALIAAMVAGFGIVCLVPGFTRYFALSIPGTDVLAPVLVVAAVACAVLEVAWQGAEWADRRWGVGKIVARWGHD